MKRYLILFCTLLLSFSLIAQEEKPEPQIEDEPVERIYPKQDRQFSYSRVILEALVNLKLGAFDYIKTDSVQVEVNYQYGAQSFKTREELFLHEPNRNIQQLWNLTGLKNDCYDSAILIDVRIKDLAAEVANNSTTYKIVGQTIFAPKLIRFRDGFGDAEIRFNDQGQITTLLSKKKGQLVDSTVIWYDDCRLKKWILHAYKYRNSSIDTGVFESTFANGQLISEESRNLGENSVVVEYYRTYTYYKNGLLKSVNYQYKDYSKRFTYQYSDGQIMLVIQKFIGMIEEKRFVIKMQAI